jgi:hypothetical protein
MIFSGRQVARIIVVATAIGLVHTACKNTPSTVAPNHVAPTGAKVAPSKNSFASNELLVQEAAQRLIAMLPPEGTLAVWLQFGLGPVVAKAKADLEARLQPEPRIVWSVASSQPGEPVADASQAGQHVHTVEHRLTPMPNVVLIVNESEGQLVFAARPPGRDPLGPETTEWTWMLYGP